MASKQLQSLSVDEYSIQYLDGLKKRRWYREAQDAAQGISGTELLSLVGGATGHFVRAGKKRITSFAQLGKLTATAVKNTAVEGKDLYRAARNRQIAAHSQQRYKAAVEVVAEKWAAGRQLVVHIKTAYERDRVQTIIDLLCLSAGFTAASGGLDGNGGVPDLDISMFGIGQHRSALTHSVIAGMAIETVAMVVMDAISLVYNKLPENHDPLWDKLFEHEQRIIGAASQGASLGISYHLVVDGVVQPAPYHDLPLSMPIEGHQALFAANAIAEGAAGIKSQKGYRVERANEFCYAGDWQYCTRCGGDGGRGSRCTICEGIGWQRREPRSQSSETT